MDDYELKQELKNDKESDARISRCFGLIGKIAVKKSNNQKVLASDVNKSDGPFYCPVCLSEAIVRKCSEKEDHFAHKAKQSPVINAKHKGLHDECKNQILEGLTESFPNGKWEAEREIPSNKIKGFKSVIPDISGRINDIPIAIEIQLSPYTINRIFEKLVKYQERKIAVLYIIPLYEELGEEPIRPRLYEKYLHSLNFGKVYYWIPGNGTKLIPVHYSPAKRWIESTSWYDTEREEERVEGGFFLTYRTIKAPNYGKTVDIIKDFQKVPKNAFNPKNEKKSIPECSIFIDNQIKWWNKDEYKNIGKQLEVIQNKPTFIEEYDSFDDYDDEY